MVKRKRGRPRKSKVVATRKKQKLSYFQLRDSYTSLLLGIGVVVIAAFLLVGFFKSNSRVNRQITDVAVETTKTQEEPTKMPSLLSTPSPEKISANAKKLPATYIVVANDTLWLVAERFYDSGYNWIDIARENKLADPGHIEVGQKLTVPNVPVKIVSSTSTGPVVDQTQQPAAITGNSYTIQRGDTLWSIAVRAYGDGFRWPDIAAANNLSHNPGLIHADNVLKIPR